MSQRRSLHICTFRGGAGPVSFIITVLSTGDCTATENFLLFNCSFLRPCIDLSILMVVWGYYVSGFDTIYQTIVNRGKWLWTPANFKGENKEATIYVGRSTTVHNLLFCTHTLWLNYVTDTYLLVKHSGRTQNVLCFVHGQGQKSEQKHGTRNFVGLHNLFRLSTLIKHEIV